MPFSNTEQLSPLMAEIVHFNPRSILDIGCGLGVYGVLCRIHLDLYHDTEFYKKLEGSKPCTVHIDGIEGCQTYIPFIPAWAYNRIYADDVLSVLPQLPDNHYDLVLLLAVIEHLSHEQGLQLLAELKRISKAIILSVPKEWQAQEIAGYPLETHRSHWTKQALLDAGFTRFLPHSGAWLAIYGIHDSAKVSSEQCVALSEIASLSSEIVSLRKDLGQVKNDLDLSLQGQQIILDRLSIRMRLTAWKRRLLGLVSRNSAP